MEAAGGITIPTADIGEWRTLNSRRKMPNLGIGVVLCVLRAQNYSDAIAREQGQVRSDVSMHRKLSVFSQEDLLHFRNCGVSVVRQRLDCPLLLGKELCIRRIIDHGGASLKDREQVRQC